MIFLIKDNFLPKKLQIYLLYIIKKIENKFFVKKLFFSAFTKKVKINFFEYMIIFKKLSKYIKINFFQ